MNKQIMHILQIKYGWKYMDENNAPVDFWRKIYIIIVEENSPFHYFC